MAWNDWINNAETFLENKVVQPTENFVNNDIVKPVENYAQNMRSQSQQLEPELYTPQQNQMNQAAGNDLKNFGQGFVRLPLSFMTKTPFIPQTMPEKALLGNQPVLPVMNNNVTQFLKNKGVSPGLASVGSTLLGGVAEAGNLVGGGDDEGILQNIAKSVDKDTEIPNLLQGLKSVKINPADIPAVSDTLSKIDNPEDVRSFLGQYKQSQPINRGFTTSVQEANNVSPETKSLVQGTYTPKPNDQLIEQGKQLWNKGIDLNAALKGMGTKNPDQVVAASIQEALSQDAAGNHEAAAELFNNLAKAGTESGRNTQAFSLLSKMTPEGIVTSAARQIQRFNEENPNSMLPELTGDQANQFLTDMKNALSLPAGREQNLAKQKVYEEINNLIPSSNGDKIFALYRTGLLTALRTPVKVGASLLAQNAAEAASRVFGSAADKGLSLFTGKSSQGLQLAGRSQGFTQGAKDAVDYLIHGYANPESGALPPDIAKNVNFGKSLVGKAFQAYVDTINRIHGTIPQAFYGGEHVSAILDMAKNAAKNGDIPNTEEAIIQLVKDATEESLKNPEAVARGGDLSTAKGIAARANAEAAYATNRDVNVISQGARAANKIPGMKFLDPFAQIAGSIVSKGLDYTPGIGQIKELASQMISKTWDQRALSQSLGRLPVGVGLTALGIALFNKGKVALGYPKSTKEVAEWQLEGKQPNSVLINGKWMDLSSLGPIGAIIQSGAQLGSGLVGNKKTPGSLLNAGSQALAGMGQTIAGSPYLQGISNLVAALQDPAGKATSFVKSEAKSIIPAGINTIATATDPYQRTTNGVVQSVQSAIPGLRESLPASVNVLGQNVPRKEGVIGSLLDPMYSSNNLSSPVINELKRLDATGNTAAPSQSTVKNLIKGTTLTTQQLSNFQQQTGQSVNQALGQLMQSPSYQQADDATKAKAIGSIFSGVKAQTKLDLTSQLQNNPKTVGSNLTLPSNQVGPESKAQDTLNKNNFIQSGKDFAIIGNYAYTANPNDPTSPTATKLPVYQHELLSAQMTQAKDQSDIKSWMNYAQQDAQALQKTINDPDTNPKDVITAQNALYTLQKDASKYQGYGGFTAGSTSTTKAQKAQTALLTATLDSYKSAGDLNGWVQTAAQQVQNLSSQLSDPNLSETEHLDIMNKMTALQKEINTYSQYGGFSKPKTANVSVKATSPKSTKSISVNKPSLKKTTIKIKGLTGGSSGASGSSGKTIRAVRNYKYAS